MRFITVKTFAVIFAFSLLGFVIACTKAVKAPPPPPTSDVNLKNGLLLYLPFSGNIADSSGNNNPTAAVSGATLTSDQNGNANSAFGGTGNGERILVTNNGSIKFDTAFTLSYNILTNSFQLQDIIAMVQNTNGEGVSFVTGLLPDSNLVDFTVMDSSATCSDVITPGVNVLIDSSRFILHPQIWYNIVNIFHKGTSKIYVNGTLVSTLSGTSNNTVPICSAAKVIVGGWWDGDPVSINGKLDEIRLYNRALNADEIAALAQGFSNGK